MAHPLETAYKLTATEILDAVAKRFRLRAALEGAVAEVHMERKIQALLGSAVEKYVQHDADGVADFSLWVPGRPEPILAECKTVRESSKPGGEGYFKKGQIVAYKVETQKTRPSNEDKSSRFYDATKFEILGVCLGKKTGNWTDILYVRVAELARHAKHPEKLKVHQRVPLPGAADLSPWYADLGQLLRDHYLTDDATATLSD